MTVPLAIRTVCARTEGPSGERMLSNPAFVDVDATKRSRGRAFDEGWPGVDRPRPSSRRLLLVGLPPWHGGAGLPGASRVLFRVGWQGPNLKGALPHTMPGAGLPAIEVRR